jgi:SPP1 gp7 family putative phage head morphogenesis protein
MRFRAFTVARLTELDAIENVRKRVSKALDDGKTLGQFWEEAGNDEILRKAGFFRGDPWYWETVFRTNVQTAYNAGRAYQFKKHPPEYLEFVGITDIRQTSICRLRSGTIRKTDDPFWSSNWPPLHFNCRSTVRAVHKEELDGLGLRETNELPKDRPAKGFGLNPIETGSYYKLTDGMIKRAKQYGIMGEIDKAAKEMGLSIKEIKGPSMPKIPKIKNIIEISDEYKTVADVEQAIRVYADMHPESFRAGFAGLKIVSDDYFMATNPTNGMIYLSNRKFKDFMPSKDLVNAFNKLRLKHALTFEEEYAIESLWHEINHNRVKRYVRMIKHSTQYKVMETINQFVSRHTYDKFMRDLGTKAQMKKVIIENGWGYSHWVSNIRLLIKKIGIKERAILKEVENILLDDSGMIYDRIIELFSRMTNITESKIRKLVADAVDLEAEEYKAILKKTLKEK